MTNELHTVARSAGHAAYAPYSGYRVGCALEAVDGRVFAGCNVENASYGLTMCAERVALGAAIAAGAREFRRMVITTEDATAPTPCGACRQVLAEFSPDMEITIIAGSRQRTWKLEALLPARFEFGAAPDDPADGR